MWFYYYFDHCCVLPERDEEVEENDVNLILASEDFGPYLDQWDEDITNLLFAALSMDVYTGPDSRSPLLERMMGKAFQAGREYEAKHFSKYWLGWVHDKGDFSSVRLYAARFGPFNSLQEAAEFQRDNPNLTLIAVKEGE